MIEDLFDVHAATRIFMDRKTMNSTDQAVAEEDWFFIVFCVAVVGSSWCYP